MDLSTNYNVTYNNNGTVDYGMISATTAANNKGTLYVMSPRERIDHIIRPLQYQFGQDFVTEVAKLTLQRNANPQMVSNHAYYLANTNAAASVLPSSTGYGIETSRYRDNWNFVLVVDVGGITGVSRNLLSGICLDYDITYNGQPNPNAKFVITSASTVDSYITNNGKNIIRGTKELDVTDQTALGAINTSGVGLNDIHPAQLLNHAYMDDAYGSSMFSIIEDQASRNGIICNDADMNNVAVHLNVLSSELTNNAGLAIDTDMFAGEIASEHNSVAAYGNNVRASLDTHRYNNVISMGSIMFRLNEVYTLSELDHMFGGSLIVHTVYQPQSDYVDKFLPAAPEAKHVYLALISNALREIMVRNGIASVSFSYVSHIPTDNIATMSADNSAFNLIEIASVIPADNDVLTRLWNQFINYLKTYLFPIIKRSSGGREFALDVSATTLGGSSYIRFNFLDDVYDSRYIEIDSAMGGLTTSLVGDDTIMKHNTLELKNAIAEVAYATGVANLSSIEY